VSDQFTGKVAVVTGSTRGIGRSIGCTLAKRGAAVALNYPNDSEAAHADGLVAEIVAHGGRAAAFKANVMNVQETELLVDDTIAAFGALDFVISNAGGPVGSSPIADCSESLFDAAIALNARNAFFVLQNAASRMRDYGRVVAIPSSTTSVAQAGLAPPRHGTRNPQRNTYSTC
jgi:3-oxoacyl-[acyl-carrier protein] reductase